MPALMTLGMFAFELATLPHSDLTRKQDWRFGEAERIGEYAAMQFLGPGAETITISGTLIPGLAGSYGSLDTLRGMADQGEPWPLLTGSGDVLGRYRIDTIDEKSGYFIDNGRPRKVDFAIDLTRVD